MTSFTNTFGGSPVSSADVAFASYSYGANATLFWPAFSSGNTNIAARFMNISTSVVNVNIFMPDATLVSVGQDNIIFNNGSNSFNIVSFSGAAIATIAPGQTYYILLNSNATQTGTWQTVQFGVGTGSASAAALAGAGLLALASLLNINFSANPLGGSTTLTTTARGSLQFWTGGAGTLTLPSAAAAGNGFVFLFANNGSGSVTVSASDNIDGASTSAFGLTQSALIISSGTTWYTVGKGTQTNFATTLLNLNVAGNADITETSAQAQNIIQQFTGALTGNINVIVPATPQIYFCFNNTSGAFTLTVKTASGGGVAITQGQNTILYCDGTSIVNAFTSSFGGAISIAAGSAGSPNLNIVGSVTTGIFSLATNQLSVSANGYIVYNFTAPASSVNYIQSSASASAVSGGVSISALGSDPNIDLSLNGKGSGHINLPNVNIDNGSMDNVVIGAKTPNLITGTTITGTTLVSTVSTGTAPFTVSSTTQVANLNAATAGTATAAVSGGITNAMLAPMPGNSVKVNSAAASGNASDTTLSTSQLLGRGSSGNVTGIALASAYSMGAATTLTPVPNVSQTGPFTPTLTVSSTGVMMGLGISSGTFTPTSGSGFRVTYCGMISNGSGAAGATAQIRFGTGAAPSNGAALTGTAIGGIAGCRNPVADGSLSFPFSVTADIAGISNNVAYWTDLSLAALTSGNAQLTSVGVSIKESR